MRNLTKEEVRRCVKDYIEEVEKTIDKFNAENQLNGYHTVWVYLDERMNWKKSKEMDEEVDDYKVMVNWSALGYKSVEEAEQFAENLNKAIQFAKKLNKVIQSGISRITCGKFMGKSRRKKDGNGNHR